LIPRRSPGLNPSLGIDLVANGNFTLGTYSMTLSVGTAPHGRIPGQNNDYKGICPCGCCPGENLVKNGDFEQGSDIGSEYKLVEGFKKLFPGTYSVNHVDGIGKFCTNWRLPKACDSTKDFYGNVLIVMARPINRPVRQR
jgi:hypothetical protein